MKERDWRADAWRLSIKHCYPGSVPVIEKALEHGYKLGLADATAEFRAAIDKVKETKEKSNQQR